MGNTIKMKTGIVKWLLVSMIGAFGLSAIPVQEAQAQNYIDSVVFKIDSARVENNDLVFSIMFWRVNQDWKETPIRTQDTVLGNTDLYFWLEDVVFNKGIAPVVDRKHAHLDMASSSGGLNLLQADAQYYAYRFVVSLRPKSTILSNMGEIPILYQKPVELCRVRLRMADPKQNPGLRWDELASGGQSTAGEPLIAAFNGDILSNPDKNIHLEDYSKKIYACEGGVAEAWVKGFSAGTNLETTWYISDEPDCINAANRIKISSGVYGNRPTGLILKTGSVSSPWGEIGYTIRCGYDGLSRVDTLYIQKVPKALHEFYLQYELTDSGLGAVRYSANGTDPSQLFVRDSIHAWFAASDPIHRDDYLSTNIGASDRTDTVFKCPSSQAVVSFYFFGPECGEEAEVIGSSMNVTYQYQDAIGNGGTKTAALSSWSKESELAPNGKCLYKGTVYIDPTITEQLVWVRSVSTANGCDNGGSYAQYDTVFIKDIEPDQSIVAVLTDTTLSAGASMVLPNQFTYTVKLQNGSAGGTLIAGNTTYKAPATSCSDPLGCTDTLIYNYTIDLGAGNTCKMEAKQAIIISETYYLSLKVLLEGGIAGNPDLMKSIEHDYFPRDPNSGQFESPYDKTHTCVALPNITGSSGEEITDWISICLRDVSDMTMVETISAFVRQDGMVFGMDGKPYVTFKGLPKKDYYVIVMHRNHLGVMSKTSIQLKTTSADVATLSIDFTNVNNVYVNSSLSTPVMQVLSSGKYALMVGDTNGDGQITMTDGNVILQNFQSGVYHNGDLNFDMGVNMTDVNIVSQKYGNRIHYN